VVSELRAAVATCIENGNMINRSCSSVSATL
jgi:hypothetical protein